jgi:hypothetical protein
MHLISRGRLAVRAVVVGAALASVLACQVIAGDFTIDESNVGVLQLGTVCGPSSFRCDGAELLVCRDDRQGFRRLETCASADRCDPTAGSCRPCNPGEFACNGAELVSCSADARWVPSATCLGPELCVISDRRELGRCEGARCDAGSFDCQETKLVRCGDAQLRYRLVEDCGDAALCDAALATEHAFEGKKPHCAAAACGDACPASCGVPGSFRCTSAGAPSVAVCGTDGEYQRLEVCESRELCSAGLGRCLAAACTPGELRCFGQVRQACSADLTHFEAIETCAGQMVCEPSGCVDGPCTDGVTRCNGVSFERCVDGVFRPEDRCATPALCSETDGCEDPTCGGLGGSFQCTGQILNRCTAGRDGWEEHDTCVAGATCDPIAGACRPAP